MEKSTMQQEMDSIIAVKINPKIKTIIKEGYSVGTISDGYHTFDELYEHRIELYIRLALLASNHKSPVGHRVWLSLKHSDGTEMPGWFILGINKEPGRQITYHIPQKYLGRLASDSRVEILDIAPEYDGHTSADVLTRLREL
jgi:hypothetical protein